MPRVYCQAFFGSSFNTGPASQRMGLRAGEITAAVFVATILI